MNNTIEPLVIRTAPMISLTNNKINTEINSNNIMIIAKFLSDNIIITL